MKKIFIVLLALSTLTAETNQKKEVPKIKHSLTFSNGYFEHTFNSNEGLSHISPSILDAQSKLFECLEEKWVQKGNRGAELLLTLGEIGFNALFVTTMVTPYHEFGHARAHKSMGRDYKYGYYTGAKDDELVDTVWGIYGQRLTHPKKWFSGAFSRAKITDKYDDWNFSQLAIAEDFIEHRTDTQLYTSIAGINNQTRAAKDIGEKLYRNGALHKTYFLHYLANKLIPLLYSNASDDGTVRDGGDIKSVVTAYKAKGYNITASNIKWGSALSTLFSGTTHAFITQYIYRSTNNPQWSLTEKMTIIPLEFKGFRIPDLNFYFTLQGLSYELVTGYRFNENFTFDLAVEYVYKGGEGWQITPGFHYTFNKANASVGTFDTFAALVIGKGTEFGGETGVSWTTPGGMFSVFGKYIYHNFNTLVGQRNIPDRTKGDIDHEICFGIAYNY